MKLLRLKSLLDSQKIAKISSFLLLIFLLSLSSFKDIKADLVDDLIKKHKLDPKNNPKDQCNLMSKLSKKTLVKNGGVCKKNYGFCCDKHGDICEASVATYYFNYDTQDFGFSTPAYYSTSYSDYSTYIFSLIYHKKQGKILGASVKIENGDDYLYINDKSLTELLKDKNFTNKIKLWIDIRNHPEFNKAKLQDKSIFFLPNHVANFDDGKLRFTSPDSIGEKGTISFDANLIKNLSYIKIRGCYIEDANINFNQLKN